MSSRACPTIWPMRAAASAPGRTTVGLATDGATLLAYALDRGTLAPIGRYEVEVEHPERLLSWLEPLLAPVPGGDADADRRRAHLRPATASPSAARMRNFGGCGPRSATIPKCG